MPTERMEEVEVVCRYPLKHFQKPSQCPECAGTSVVRAKVPEGSLTAARLRLADAAEKLGFIPDAMGDFEEQFNDALAALRTARGA